MNVRTVKPLVLAVVALGAATLIFILSPCFARRGRTFSTFVVRGPRTGITGDSAPTYRRQAPDRRRRHRWPAHARTGCCALWCTESAPARINAAVTIGPVPFAPPFPGTYR